MCHSVVQQRQASNTGKTWRKLSIQPSIFCHLSESRWWWQQTEKGSSDLLLLEDLEAVPGHMGYIIPSICFGPTLGPLKWASRRHPTQVAEPPQLALFSMKEQQFYSDLLPDVWPLPMTLRLSPDALQRKLISADYESLECLPFLGREALQTRRSGVGFFWTFEWGAETGAQF